MQEQSGFISTYKSVFQLYRKIFIPVIPILAVYLLIKFLIDDIFSFKESFQNVLINSVITIPFSDLLSCALIFASYQQHKNLRYNFKEILTKCANCFLPFIGATIIFSIPFLIYIAFMLYYINLNPDINTMIVTYPSLIFKIILQTPELLSGILFLSVCYLVIGVYFYLTFYLIVIEKLKALEGIKQSWKLIRGNWFRTFTLIVLLVVIQSLIVYIVKHFFNNSICQEYISILLSPLSAALMVIHYENLKKQSSKNSLPH